MSLKIRRRDENITNTNCHADAAANARDRTETNMSPILRWELGRGEGMINDLEFIQFDPTFSPQNHEEKK